MCVVDCGCVLKVGVVECGIFVMVGVWLRAHNTKSPRSLCNGYTSGIKPSEFCTVLEYR